jgi:hypothetical protein
VSTNSLDKGYCSLCSRLFQIVPGEGPGDHGYDEILELDSAVTMFKDSLDKNIVPNVRLALAGIAIPVQNVSNYFPDETDVKNMSSLYLRQVYPC